jgi:hypothetical protein
MVKVSVSSDVKITLSPDMLLTFQFQPPETEMDVPSYVTSAIKQRDLSLVSKLATEKFTFGEVSKMLQKAKELIQASEGYLAYSFKKHFSGNSKEQGGWSGHKPGTVQIFSKDHICFYDGRDWNKLPT